jgi:acyl-CoA synthetase (AMP-forming)/AMP-acid ligase II
MVVPTMLIRIMDHHDFRKYNTKSLRSIVYTGSPMPVEQMRRAMELFGPVLYQGFGMTEGGGQMSLPTSDHVLAIQNPEKQRLLNSVGKCLPGCEMRLFDDSDRDVKRGEIGEIVFRSPAMIDGYWNKPKETAELLRSGWLHTGDMGRLDEDGYLYIVDRKKDVIVSGAEKIPSKEVEEVIYQFPVAEVAVVGVPSKEWGEEIKAIVVAREGVPTTPEAIIEFCNERLSGFKRPRTVEIWKELPKNATGKILKRDIREKFWAGREKRVS